MFRSQVLRRISASRFKSHLTSPFVPTSIFSRSYSMSTDPTLITIAPEDIPQVEKETSYNEDFVSRAMTSSTLAPEARDGVGARMRRPLHFNLDPFLMMDNFMVQAPGGFPSHPHRGFETVTYIFDDSPGSFQHEDFLGNKGILEPGSIQWMTAGRGIVHAEMPVDKNLCKGIQLWVNLRKTDKMCKPAYQELSKSQLLTSEYNGVWARIIAGNALGAKSNILTRTPAEFIHFRMKPNAILEHKIPSHYNGLLYVVKGGVWVGPEANERYKAELQKEYSSIILKGSPKHTDGLRVIASDQGAEFVLVVGEPIKEPTVQYGPFVMNTSEEINNAISDYRTGKHGFEKAPTFIASIDSTKY